MTSRATAVPILVNAGPVEAVVGRYPSVWIEVKPTLIVDVPGETQRLNVTAVERDEVLLQSLNPGGVRHLKFQYRAVRPVRLHEVNVAATTKTRCGPVMFEDRVVEIAEHIFRSGAPHRPRVMGVLPPLRLQGMAAATRRRGDVPREFRSKRFFTGARILAYRALAAVAQFGSDLDKASQQQLHRGERLTEILKQGQYSTLPVEKQIAIIFAGTNGYLDDLAVADCRPFENELYEYLERQEGGVLDKIREKKALDEALTEELKSALREFKERFQSQRSTRAAS